MAFNPSKNLSDQIADYLIDQVVNLKIVPGERIMEEKLAKELGVSRSPVREALRVLEQTGLVELIPRCGARVTPITEEKIESYCDMFILVLGHVTRRCIEKCTEKHLVLLTDAYKEMESYARIEEPKKFYQSLLRCVEIGIEVTENPALEQVVKSIMPNLKRLQYIAIILKSDSLADAFMYFKQILDALYEKNPEKGVKAIEDYISSEMKRTLTTVKNSSLAQFIADYGENSDRGLTAFHE